MSREIVLLQTGAVTGAYEYNARTLLALINEHAPQGAFCIAPAGALTGWLPGERFVRDAAFERALETLVRGLEKGRELLLSLPGETAPEHWLVSEHGTTLLEDHVKLCARTWSFLPRPDAVWLDIDAMEAFVDEAEEPEAPEAGAYGRVTLRLAGFAEDFVGAGLTRWETAEETVELARFVDGLLTLSFDEGVLAHAKPVLLNEPAKLASDLRYGALVDALRRLLTLTRAKGFVLGLSGGVDSAVVLPMAVEAAGADRVRALMMPTDYTSSASLEDAATMAERLGVRYDVVSIRKLFGDYEATLTDFLEPASRGITEENLQARIRANLLMACANREGRLVLCTSNLSEAMTGYGTLYGDVTGAWAPLKGLWKSDVYELAKELAASGVIPQRVIDRAPSAELSPGQKDSDSLPPYDDIERVLRATSSGASPEGVDAQTVERILSAARRAAFKRRQSPPGPDFGIGPADVFDWTTTPV